MNNCFTVLLLFVLFTLFTTVSASENTGSLPVLVYDIQTGNPIAGATICIGSDSLCLESDSSGVVLFADLPPGRYPVSVNAVHYQPETEWNVIVNRGNNHQLVFDLMREVITDLDKMTVSVPKRTHMKPSQSTSATRYSSFELTHTAGTADDISRVLATNPGVVSMPGATDDNTMYVRGGGSNENVFVIDGIELDNANHFSDVKTSGGAMSFLSGALVRELDFYTGGFPARLPPRLSSVVDMHLRNGSFTGYHTEVDANIAGFGFTTEGPITHRCSFLTNIRMVDLSPLDRFLDLEGIPRFGDGLLKLVYTPDDHSTVRMLGIGAIDNYHEKLDIFDFPFPTSYDEWVYQGGGIVDWTYHTNSMKNTVSFSGTARKEIRHDDAIDAADAMEPDTFIANLSEYHRSNTIIDTMVLTADSMYVETSRYTAKRLWEKNDRRRNMVLKDDVTLFLRGNDQFSAGVVGAGTRYRIKNSSASEGRSVLLFELNDSQVVEPDYSWDTFDNDSVLDVRHAGAYAEYVFNDGWIKAVAGLRADYYTVITDYGISPRIGLQLNPCGSTGTFGLSGGLYYQFPSDFSGLIGEIIAANPNYTAYRKVPLDQARLQRNWQGVFRYERPIGESHQLTFETYGKWYDREYPFQSPGNRRYTGFSQGDGPYTWLLDKADGKKRAYGAEVLFSKNIHDRFYYSCAYSLFRVENKYTNGKWYRDENDVGGVLGLTLGSNFARNHGLSLRLAASGGRPYSAIKKTVLGNGFEYDTAKGYYTESLDPILSTNLRYQFTSNLSWGSVTGYVEFWNVLDRTPVAQRFFNRSRGYSDMTLNGMVPVAGINVSW